MGESLHDDVIVRQARLIRASGLFDEAWYLDRYRDVAALAIDPVEHYLRWGARLRRNPGPRFDTGHYLRSNRDVAAAGINPLVHYISYGRRERRSPLPAPPMASDFDIAVDVVIAVFNALDEVKRCLASVRDRRDGFRVRAIVVNDGSDAKTSRWLREFCAQTHGFKLLEHEENRGYTRAINTGLRASNAPYVITLNSDTVVTRGWLRGMVRCMTSAPDIGIVGPLSNAASWQNVPYLYGDDRKFAINDLSGLSVEDMARIVCSASRRKYPRIPFVNGFCFMISRRVLESVGLMDEDGFPIGYGEENDYCIRAADAGFKLAIADDAFVFHEKSKSFGHDKRKELSSLGSDKLREKHSEEKVSRLLAQLKTSAEMDLIRRNVQLALAAGLPPVGTVNLTSLRILFLLPVQGGGGGAHSVVQEAAEMLRMNVDVKVAVPKGMVENFVSQYPDIPVAADLFIDISTRNVVANAGEFDVVIGTIYRSMTMVSEIARRHPHVLPAYYVQDYEPLFFPAGSPKWHDARSSYALVPDCLLFAKTAWIIGKVKKEHGLRVARVYPSIDHDVYYPGTGRAPGPIRIAAMIRPQTPRRGAQRTMRVFKRLSDKYGDRVTFDLFGCDVADDLFQELERGFPFVQHGRLTRSAVADLLRRSDLFVDLSDYQAFGRTALEAMACGCMSAVTRYGGADEYAVDDVNALLLDSLDEESCFQRLAAVVEQLDRYQDLRLNGIESAAGYSVHRAAVSILLALQKEYVRQGRTLPARDTGGSDQRSASTADLRRLGEPAAEAASSAQGLAALASVRERYRELARLTRIVIEREQANMQLAERMRKLEKDNATLARRLAESEGRILKATVEQKDG